MSQITEDPLSRARRLLEARRRLRAIQSRRLAPDATTPQAASVGLTRPPPGVGAVPIGPLGGFDSARIGEFVPPDPSLVIDHRTAQDPAMERFATGFAGSAASGIATISRALGFAIQQTPGVPKSPLQQLAGQILINRGREAQELVEREGPDGFAGVAGEFLGMFADPVFIGSFLAAGKIVGRGITAIAGKLGIRAEQAAIAAGKTPEVAARIRGFVESGVAGAGIGAAGIGTLGAVEGFAEEGSVVDAAGGAVIGSAEGLAFGAIIGVSARALLGAIARINPAVKQIIETPMSEFAARRELGLKRFGKLTEEEIGRARTAGVFARHSDRLGTNRTPEAISAADAATARTLKAADTLLKRRQAVAAKPPPAAGPPPPPTVEPSKGLARPSVKGPEPVAARPVAEAGFEAETVGAKIVIGAHLDSGRVEVIHPKGKATGYLRNRDMPGEANVESQGELFFVKRDKDGPRGLGFSLAKDALRVMKDSGAETVIMRVPSTKVGKAMVDRLIEEGIIGPAIKTTDTGTSLHNLTFAPPTPPKSKGLAPAKPKATPKPVKPPIQPPGPFRRGIVNLDLFSKPVEAAVKVGKWTASTTDNAARWLWSTFGGARLSFGKAKKAITKRFGDFAAKHFPSIWKRWVAMRVEVGKSDTFRSDQPARVTDIPALNKALKQARRENVDIAEELHQQRSKQAKELKHIQQTASGAMGVKLQAQALQGQIVDRSNGAIKPLIDEIGEAMADRLINHVTHHWLFRPRPFDAKRAGMVMHDLIHHGRVPTDGEILLLEATLGPEFKALIRKLRSAKAKVGAIAYDLWMTPKSLVASADQSAVLRQGLYVTLQHPKRAFKAYGQQWLAFLPGRGFKNWGRAYAKQIEVDLQNRSMLVFEPEYLSGLSRKNLETIADATNVDIEGLSDATARTLLSSVNMGKVGEQAGLELTFLDGPLTRAEELWQAKLIEKIPIIGRIIQQSNQAFGTYLNIMRAHAFDYMAKRILRTSNATPAQKRRALREHAFLINAMTGRSKFAKGSKGESDRLHKILQSGLWSPHFMFSRFEYAGRVPTQIVRGFIRASRENDAAARYTAKYATKVLVTDLAYFAGLWALLDHANEAFGWDISFSLNPRNPTFLKLRFKGKTSIDLAGGLGNTIRFVFETFVPRHDDQKGISAGWRKNPDTGRWERMYGGNPLQATAKFLENKLNPPTAAVQHAYRGKRFGGKDLTFFGVLGDITIPITGQNIVEVSEEHDWAAGLWLDAFEFTGAGVNIYDPPTRKSKGKPQARSISESF